MNNNHPGWNSAPSSAGDQNANLNLQQVPEQSQEREAVIEFKYPQTVAGTNSSGGKAPAPGKAMVKADLDSEDYLKRRQRNNIAVKKSREKSREKSQVTEERIEKLQVENSALENKLQVLNKELSILKKVFMDHAKGFSGSGADLPGLEQLEVLLGHKLTDKPGTSRNSNQEPGPSSSNQ
uniref:BZIP domain-containing protein n=1 Tax=Ciona savignyi TaxID=51511 RepID=H2YC01_CIOSA